MMRWKQRWIWTNISKTAGKCIHAQWDVIWLDTALAQEYWLFMKNKRLKR